MKLLRSSLVAVLLAGLLSAGVWGAGQQILFSYNAAGIEEQLIHQVTADFLAENPGVNVELQNIVGSHGGGWFDQLLVRIAANVDIPDVYLMEYNKALGLISSGRVMALDSLIQRDRVNINDLVPAGLEGISYQGRIYGLPSRVDGLLFFVNTDQLANAGFNLPGNNWTLDEMLKIGRSLTRDTDSDGKPEVWGLDFNGVRWTFPVWQTIFGGRIFDSAGETAIDRPESVRALQYAHDMVFGYGMTPNPTAMPGGVGFYQGTTGMLYNYAWHIRDLRAQVDFGWDILPLPVGPGGEGNLLLGNLFMVDAQTQQPELAWKLMQHLYSTKVQTRFAVEAGSIYPRKSFFASNVYAKSGMAPSNLPAITQAYMVAGSYPAVPNLDTVRGSISDAVIASFQKQQPPQEALAGAAAKIRAAMRDLSK